MRRFKGRIWIAVFLFLGVFVTGIGRFWFNYREKKPVGPRQMQEYGETYLRKYNNLVEKAVLPKYRKHFNEHVNAPFMINAVISSTHGAALEFIPSEKSTFRCRTATNRIDKEVFHEKDPNNSKMLKTKSVIERLGLPKIDTYIKMGNKDLSLKGLSV